MKKLNLVLCSIIFVAISCGTKQDPLEDKPEAVRNGKLPSQKVEKVVPEESEVIRIDTVNKYTFVEGREDKISIMVRVLAPDFENQVQIVNQSEFPDSTFDQATGVFSWKPAKGFIFDGLSKNLELNIRVFSKSTKEGQERVFTKDKIVDIVVEKAMGAPVIVKVDGLPNGYNENDSYTFTVLVRDEDAGPVQESFPRLVFTGPSYGTISLAPFIRMSRVEPDFLKREFLYTYTVDMKGTNLTDGYSSAGFSVRAISRYDVQSLVTTVDSKVLASYGTPKASWTNEIEMQTATTVNYSFVVYESTARAEFEIIEMKDLPGGATLTCDTLNAKGVMPCTLSWAVPVDQALISGSITLTVKALKKYYSDVKPVESEIQLDYIVTSPGAQSVRVPKKPKTPPKKEVRP
jgi:hypothetical protein